MTEQHKADGDQMGGKVTKNRAYMYMDAHVASSQQDQQQESCQNEQPQTHAWVAIQWPLPAKPAAVVESWFTAENSRGNSGGRTYFMAYSQNTTE